jgi:predicted transcriptional regulator of viral defense system
MNNYDVIYEYAADNYGLITSAEAKAIGIPNVEIVKLAHRGRLERIGHGVYRVTHYIPTPLDKYAEAVAMVGEGAYIFGESVLTMHCLALINPTVIYVATPNKIRKTLPLYIVTVFRKPVDQVVVHEGIPSQRVADALLECRTSIMTERIEDAAKEAERQGLITNKDADSIRKVIKHERKST